MKLRKVWGFFICFVSLAAALFYLYVPFVESMVVWRVAMSIPVILAMLVILAIIFMTGRAMIQIREPPRVK